MMGKLAKLFAVTFTALALALLLMSINGWANANAQTDSPFRLIESNTNHVVVDFDLGDYRITQVRQASGLFSAIDAPGFDKLNNPGSPVLPVKGVMLGIPAGAEVSFQIRADDSGNVGLPNRIELAVQPEIPPTDLQTGLPAWRGQTQTPDRPEFKSNAIYPTVPATMSSASFIRSQRYVAVRFFPFQFEFASKQLIVHRHMRVEVTFTYPHGVNASVIGSSLPEPQLDGLLRDTLLNFDTARLWRSMAIAQPADTRSPQNATISGPLFRMSTPSEGMYQVTCPDLQSAGLSAGSYDPNTIKVLKAGTELAIVQSGAWSGSCLSSDSLMFYADKLQSIYTDTNIYWLTVGGAAGKRSLQVDGSGAGATPAYFGDAAHFEVNSKYYGFPGLPENMDHWYWQIPANSFDRGFHVDNPTPSLYSASLTIRYVGFNATGHEVVTFLNGVQVGDSTWFGQGIETATLPISQSLLSAITNTLTFSEAIGWPASNVALDFYDVNYARSFTATNDSLHFRQAQPGAWRFSLGGFVSPNIRIFDISDKYSMTQVINASTSLSGGLTQVQFAASPVAPAEYIVLSDAQINKPDSITRAAAPHLKDASNAADYIIISYGGFMTATQPLAAYRAGQGMRVKTVDVQDVYDEFSDGLMDAQAIHDFLAFAYSHWQSPAPFYVLLVGDGQYDFKHYMGGTSVNYIPPYRRDVDPVAGETASDNRLVAFNLPTDTMPSMALGRLPANSTAEVDTMVGKILAYEQNPPPGAWRSTVAFVSDNAFQTDGSPDGGGNFWSLSDEVARNPTYFRPPLIADRIFYNPCLDTVSFPQCALPYTPVYSTGTATTAGIIGAINAGRIIVNYVGHGATGTWAGTPVLFHITDIDQLTNATRLPMILGMTCLDGAFDVPLASSLAELQVRKAGGGAIASWSSTGQGYANGHDFLDKGFFDAVVNKHQYQIGKATMAGLLNVQVNSPSNLDLIATFILFGDPATKLAIMPSALYLPLVTR